jgi:hypothetical protein
MAGSRYLGATAIGRKGSSLAGCGDVEECRRRRDSPSSSFKISVIDILSPFLLADSAEEPLRSFRKESVIVDKSKASIRVFD